MADTNEAHQAIPMRSTSGSRFTAWLPAIAMVVAVLVGYVQLSEAVKANARSIERQSRTLEKITQLLQNDVRHDEQISTLRRDLQVIWAELKEHRAKSSYDSPDN